MSEKTAIHISNLKKSYKDVEVLRGINLTIKKGSIFALLGSNGAGKTTTIKILSTLIKPDAGEVMLAGINVLEKPQEAKKHIALTGQYAAVDDVLTGRENLEMIGKLLGVKSINEEVNGLLAQFNLSNDADRRVSTYSGGMKRKIDIAMSLIGNPDVIFLDEPTTGLDPQSRKTMWEMIRQLSGSGVTIFLTTQYLDEAEVLADKIAILDKGIIITQGTKDEIKDIIPSNIIELYFKTAKDTDKAVELLCDYEVNKHGNNRYLKIKTHAAMDSIMNIFTILRNADIELENFERKKASLEDVFLKVISSDTERSALNAHII